MDLLTDYLVGSRGFRLLTMIDDYNRESLAVEAEVFFLQQVYPGLAKPDGTQGCTSVHPSR